MELKVRVFMNVFLNFQDGIFTVYCDVQDPLRNFSSDTW
jgi:hypothetical protein